MTGRPLVGTSLKMNLTSTELRGYLDTLLPLVDGVASCDVFVLPSFPALWVAQAALAGSSIAWGAQDVHEEEAGAHTGDVSESMLADLGCTYVEIGHAERRRDHGESAEIIARKAARIVAHGMLPIICVGEREQLPPTEAIKIVLGDVATCLSLVAPGQRHGAVIAYEPAWAIGEGAQPASPKHVAAIHSAIHNHLESAAGGGVDLRAIYGGSVDAASAAYLLDQPGVDGLFVGRAALDPAHLADIARVASGLARHSEPTVTRS